MSRRRRRRHSAHLAALCLFALSAPLPVTRAQLVNGQFFTNGLTIVDAPQASSTQHGGSNLPIALDLSGNGKLPQSSFVAGSGLATAYRLLEIYLINEDQGLNLTVSQGAGLLSQESGSTVKHLDYQVPLCVKTALYNFTIHETATINNEDFYTITFIPIQIESKGKKDPSSPCGAADGTNPILPLPLASKPFSGSPWVNKLAIATGPADAGTPPPPPAPPRSSSQPSPPAPNDPPPAPSLPPTPPTPPKRPTGAITSSAAATSSPPTAVTVSTTSTERSSATTAGEQTSALATTSTPSPAALASDSAAAAASTPAAQDSPAAPVVSSSPVSSPQTSTSQLLPVPPSTSTTTSISSSDAAPSFTFVPDPAPSAAQPPVPESPLQAGAADPSTSTRNDLYTSTYYGPFVTTVKAEGGSSMVLTLIEPTATTTGTIIRAGANTPFGVPLIGIANSAAARRDGLCSSSILVFPCLLVFLAQC